MALLPLVRKLVDERPSDGYRRLTALLDRQLRSEGNPTVNAKRVLRFLQVNGLTLARHTALRPRRTHDGVVVALRSNVRWCSDHLELHCRDRSTVRVLFAIDACDRGAIPARLATNETDMPGSTLACTSEPSRRLTTDDAA